MRPGSDAAFREDLPLEAVEWIIEQTRVRLPPRNTSSACHPMHGPSVLPWKQPRR